MQSIQVFAVDTKGGNRPIRLALRKQGLGQASFGKVFMLAYSFGDKLVIQDNWVMTPMTEKEQSYALQESLHGKEILAV